MVRERRGERGEEEEEEEEGSSALGAARRAYSGSELPREVVWKWVGGWVGGWDEGVKGQVPRLD